MSRALASSLVAIVLAAGGGCARQDARIQLHREKLESLGATARAIGHAWLDGAVSGTYTDTALEQTFRLVEQERTALAAAPPALLDPRGAQLSQAAERLSRLLATMQHDVRAADAAALRKRLADVPILPAQP